MKFYEEGKLVSLRERVKEALKDYQPGQSFFVLDLCEEMEYLPDSRGGSNYIKGILAKMGFKFKAVDGKLVAWKEKKGNESLNSKS